MSDTLLPPETQIAAPIAAARPFDWARQITSAERKSLVAGAFGWMLDAMDVMLYSLVLTYLIREFSMDTRTAGFLNSLTLVASAVGGLLFGVVGLQVSAMSAAAAVHSPPMPKPSTKRNAANCATEWENAQAALASEYTRIDTIKERVRPMRSAEHRGKALGLMQSAYAIGEAIAALVVGLVLPHFGWRAVFLVGVLPALLVFWIQSSVPEPPLWTERRTANAARPPLRHLLSGKVLRAGLLATTMNTCALFGYWGLFTWIPAYLSLSPTQGGRGLSLVKTTTFFLVLCAGKFLGYATFGFFADIFGRRKPYFAYLLVAAALVPVYGMTGSPTLLLFLGPLVAFFGTGSFSGYAAIASEIFPGEIRATAMGFSYNVGRGVSAVAPFVVGALAVKHGIGPAFLAQAGAFLAAALLSLLLSETRGSRLT